MGISLRFVATCISVAIAGAQEVVVDINSIIEQDRAQKESALMQELSFSSSKWLARSQFALYALSNDIPLSPERIEEHFFAHLNAAAPTETTERIPFQSTKFLPPLMCQWLTQRECASVLHTFDEYLHDTTLSDEQKKFYRTVAYIAFNAQKYARTSRINPPVYKFIRECHKSGYPIYLIGNTNGACFEELQKRFAAELSLFDEHHRYLSYQDGLLKPTAKFYDAFKEHCALQSDDSIVCLEGETTQAHMPASACHLSSCVYVTTQPENLQRYLEQPRPK